MGTGSAVFFNFFNKDSVNAEAASTLKVSTFLYKLYTDIQGKIKIECICKIAVINQKDLQLGLLC